MTKDLTGRSIEQLVERFVELAILMGEDGEAGLNRPYTRKFREQYAIANELWSRSALQTLLPSLEHENPWVRYLSAANCWEIDRERTEATLEALGEIEFWTVGIEARISLRIFRSGDAVLRGPSPARS